MAATQELERLVITLTAQSKQYERVLKDAESRIAGTAKIIEAESRHAQALTEAMLTPTERYIQKMDELDRMLSAGQISQETYYRAMKQMNDQLPHVAQAAAKMADSINRAKQVTESVLTPQEQYNRKVKELKELHSQGLLTSTAYNRALTQAAKSLPQVQQAQEQLNAATTKAAAVTTAALTPVERYSQELKELDALLDAGHISQETYNRTTERLYSQLPRVAAAQDKLNKELQEAARITQAMKSPTQNYNEEVRRLQGHLAAGRISQQTYNAAVRQAHSQLPQVQAAMKAYADQQARARQIIQQTLPVQAQYNQRVTELNNLHRQGHMSASQHARAMSALNVEFGKVKDWGKGISAAGQGTTQLGQGISNVGQKLTMGITVPVTGMLAAATHFGGQFEASLHTLQAAAQPTQDQLERTREAALATSEAFGFDPTATVQAYTELLKASVPLEKVLAEAGQAALQFAHIGEMEAGVAAVVLADAMNVFGESATYSADVLSAAADASSISVKQIAEAFSQVSAVAANANQDLKSVSTAIAVLGNAGVKGSDAGTSLKTMLLRLMAPSTEGAKVMEEFGLQIRDASGQILPMQQLIAELTAKMGHLDQETKDNALKDLFGQDAIRAAQIFMKQGEEGFVAISEAMDNAATTAEKYAMMTAGLHAQTGFALSDLKRLWIELFVIIQPVLAKVVTFIRSVVNAVTEWIRTNPQLAQIVVVVSAIAAAVGPLLVVVGTAIAMFGGLVTAVAAFMFVGWEVVAIAAAIAAGFVVLIAQVALVGAAFAAAVYWLVGADGIAAGWEYITSVVSTAIQTIIGFVANLSTNLQVFMEWFPRNWQNVVKDLIQLWILFQVNMLSNAMTMISTMFRLWTAWQGFMFGLWKKVFSVDFLKAVWDGVKAAAKVFVDFAQSAWKTITSIFSGKGKNATMGDFLGQMKSDFAGGEEDILGTTKKIMQEGMNDLKGPFEGFKSNIEEVPKFVYDMGVKSGEAVGEGVKAGAAAKAADAAAGVAAVTAAVSEEMIKLQEDVDTLTKSYEEQVLSFGKAGREAEIFALKLRGATEEQLKGAKAADAALTKLEKQKELMDKGKALFEEMKTPLEKFADRQKELKEMLAAGAIDIETFNRAMAKANKEIAGDHTVKFNVAGIQGVEAGTAEAAARLAEFRALAPKAGLPVPANALAARAGGAAVAPANPAGIKAAAAQVGIDITKERDAKLTEAVNWLRQIAANTADMANKELVEFKPADISGL